MLDESQVLLVRAVDPAGTPLSGVTLHARRGPWQLSAQTGADGRAAFAGVPAGRSPLYVTAHPIGDWAAGKVLPAVPPEEVELAMARAPSVCVRVLDAQGRPAPGIAVVGQPDTGKSDALEVKGRTGADGSYRWKGPLPGPYRIGVALAVSSRRFQWADMARWIELAAGEEALVELQLQRPGELDCRVQFDRGGPAAGVELWLEHHDVRIWSSLRKAVVAEDGSARFVGLQPGRYRLQSSGSANAEGTPVEIAEGSTVLHLVVPDRSDLPVEVVDDQEHPVAGATVMGQVVQTSEQQSCVTDEQGRAVLSWVAHGEVYLSVQHARGQCLLVRPHDGSSQRLVLEPVRTLLVRGEVAASDGTRISVRWKNNFKAGQVEAGRFEVRLDLGQAESGTLSVRVGDTVPVARAFGADDTLLDLGRLQPQEGASLRGRVDDGGWTQRGAFTWIEVRCPSAGIVHDRIERDGSFLIRGLPRETVELYLVVHSPTPDRAQKGALLSVDLAASSGELGLIELE